MKRPHLAVLPILLLCTALACNSAQLGQSWAPSGASLFKDAFDDPHSGWGELNSAAGTAGYSAGTYHFYIKSPNVNLWAHPGLDLATVDIEVDATAAAGSPPANRLGLVCRLKDDANFYYFFISTDGYYGIGKVRNGTWSLLGNPAMQQSAAIQPGNLVNHLRADCIGSLLILRVNGQLVGSARDTDFTSGDVGLLAGAFDQPGVDVSFDNFSVIKP